MNWYRFLLCAVFYFFLCNYSGLSQNQQKVDSLKVLLKEATSDSIKIQLYGNISWIYAGPLARTDIAKKYADSIRMLAEQLKNENGIAKYHFYSGFIDRLENNQTSGLVHLKKYVDYHKSQGDSAKVAGGLYQIASIQQNIGNYKESMSTYYRVLAIEVNDKNEYSIAYTTQAIGIILSEIQSYDEAIVHYNKALDIFNKLDKKIDIANVHVNLGNAYVKMHKVEEANGHYQSALVMYEDNGQKRGVATTLANIAFMYDEMKQYETAMEFHNKALEIRKTISGKEDLARSFLAVGMGYRKLQDFTKAKYYLNNALIRAEEIEAKPLKRDVYKNLASIYAIERNFYKAYETQQLLATIKDSILNEDSSRQLSELQTKYETTQKDQEITLLTKENEIQQAKAEKDSTLRSALIGGLLLLGIIAGMIFYTMRTRLKNQKLLAIKNEEIQMANLKEQLGALEMKALRAQMNPHFLFNCMNSINRMIMAEENDKASKYLSKFSKLVRLLLENSENPKVNLKDELEMLKSYIELESIRFKNKMEYKINVSESIDQESTYIPSMVLQPFVENAIWHGLLHKDTKGQLTIDIKEEGDNLHCSITDNGVGREKSLKLQKQSGHKKISMGIKITTDRLKLLTKQKISEAIKILDLKDSENNALGTQVNILIPIS